MAFAIPNLLIAAVCLPLGALAVVWMVLAYSSQRRFLAKALRATGQVQSVKAERIDKTTLYFPLIRFTTAAGSSVTAESKTSKSGGAYQVGQAIKILYDPNQPSHMEIDAMWSRWLGVAVATLFAVVLLGVGVAALMVH